MRALRKAAVAAAVLGGLLAMGAGPPMPVAPLSRAELAVRMLPTPRLFEMTTVIDGKSTGTTQFCESAESMLRQMNVARPPAPASGSGPTPAGSSANGVGAAPGAGCKHAFDHRPNGSTHMEVTCDKAAGARLTSHSIVDMVGDMQDMRVHRAVTFDGAPPRTMVTDTHTVMKGDCPADLRPGEMRMPDGTKRDMARRAATAGGEAKAAH